MKKLYEGASIGMGLVFLLLVGLGFFAKTKEHHKKVEYKKQQERKIEKEKKRQEAGAQRAKEFREKEVTRMMLEQEKELQQILEELEQTRDLYRMTRQRNKELEEGRSPQKGEESSFWNPFYKNTPTQKEKD
jgi:hypothetical protein